jgi:hypothetical protein
MLLSEYFPEMLFKVLGLGVNIAWYLFCRLVRNVPMQISQAFVDASKQAFLAA